MPTSKTRLAIELLERGWFPRELPPPFSTSQFAKAVELNALSPSRRSEFADASLGVHTMPRYGSMRRDVALVHPRAQHGLCSEIASAWPELERHFNRSHVSASTPKRQAAGRAVERTVARPDLGSKRALSRVGAKWLLRTDIARFYPSIYTHTLPWSLHGRLVGKGDHSDALLGNRIDAWTRKGQSGETIGIPIGPDTSLILAEIVLSAVDAQLMKTQPRIRALRYMDDYEFALSSESEAHDVLGSLQLALHEHRLALNDKKTQALRLPQQLQQPWATVLRRLDIRNASSHEEADVVAYFDAAFEQAQSFPGEPVLNFALARLVTFPLVVRDASRDVLDALMLQAMLVEPGTHRYVI